ncbi:MAG: SAM-dependent DNA methyltransferase [Chloroflexi bacterium]|nr:SAM-dependent DNA methyltransferase [Chloroflexota bacterium]
MPTPTALADLMAGWAVRDEAAVVLDPACGAGGLLARTAAWRADRSGALPALLGVEADPQLAALARRALAATGARIIDADFLALPPAPPAATLAVVANPPFVRHERLAGDGAARWAMAARGGLDGRADLHAYFWPALAAWLAPGERAAVVTPASWLEADYGAAVRRFLLDHFALDAIVEPAGERWFPEVGVHAVLVLARRCGPGVTTGAPVRLVRLRRRLTDVLGVPGPDRSVAVAGLVARLDALATDEETATWQARLIAPVRLGAGARPGAGGRRAVPPPTRRLPAAPADTTRLLSWSAWLRAPACLTALLARTADRWTSLGGLARVRYPLKTGADGFFYLSAATAAAWEIEPECLRPVVRSPRQLTGLTIALAALPWHVLLLPAVTPAALPPGARRYVTAGIAAGLDHRPTCATRRPWYALPVLPPAPLLWPRFIHARHAVWLNPEGAVENQTFYGLLPEPALAPALAAVLNSSLGALVMEVCGRGSLGDGALQYAVSQAAAVPVPDLRAADPHSRAALAEALRAVASATDWAPLAGPGASDARGALDDRVLALLGIADDGERAALATNVRGALARLVGERRQRGAGHAPGYRCAPIGATVAAKTGSARSIMASLAVSEMRT